MMMTTSCLRFFHVSFRANVLCTVVFLLILLSIVEVKGDAEVISASSKLHDTIYTRIKAYSSVRIVGPDGPIGSNSKRGGENAPFSNFIASQKDLDWLRDHGPNGPYYVVMEPEFFNNKVVNSLVERKLVAGIVVVLLDTSEDIGWSPADTIPNLKYGNVNNSFIWNPTGNGFIWKSFDFPIFAVDKKYAESVREMAKFNSPTRSWPLWGARLNNFMNAGDGLATCLRRERCDPLGQQSMLGFLRPRNTTSNNNTMIISTTLDALSFFQDLSWGADAHVSGMVTLLAVAQALGNLSDSEKASFSTNIAFVGFNGEHFGYIGSSKLAHNMRTLETPFNITDVKYMLEIGQVGSNRSSTEGLYYHTDPGNDGYDDQKTLSNKLKTIAGNITTNIRFAGTAAHELPPASLQVFIKEAAKVGHSISSAVFTDHAGEFTNMNYQSEFDNYHNVDNETRLMCDLATIVAQTAYTIGTGKEPEGLNLVADCYYLRTVFDCFTKNYSCPLFKEMFVNENFRLPVTGMDILNIKSLPSEILSRYVGVYQGRGVSKPSSPVRISFPVLIWSGLLTKNIAYKSVEMKPSECVAESKKRKTRKVPYVDGIKVNQIDNQNDGSPFGNRCYYADILPYEAVSPAFVYDGVKHEWTIGDMSYSLYAESRWENGIPSFETFQIGSPRNGIAIILVGLLFAGATCVIILVLAKHEDTLLRKLE